VSGHDGTTARTGIVSGRTARKGRNLERDPRCAVSLSTKGYDVVVEGTAELVTDPDLVSAAAERFAAGGWPCVVDESGTALTDP
jgi:Pyridoxamine 5'-phosphate oxidase